MLCAWGEAVMRAHYGRVGDLSDAAVLLVVFVGDACRPWAHRQRTTARGTTADRARRVAACAIPDFRVRIHEIRMRTRHQRAVVDPF